VSIYLGLGLRPQRCHPMVEQVNEAALRTHFSRLHQAIAQTAAAMPPHGEWLARLTGVQPAASQR
jgi:tryptophan halogenase